MKYEKNHKHYVGQLIREGNFVMRVTWVFWHWYEVDRYSFGIFSDKNKGWAKPMPWTSEQLIRRGIVTR